MNSQIIRELTDNMILNLVYDIQQLYRLCPSVGDSPENQHRLRAALEALQRENVESRYKIERIAYARYKLVRA